MINEQISNQNVNSLEKKITYEPSNNDFILIMVELFKDEQS